MVLSCWLAGFGAVGGLALLVPGGASWRYGCLGGWQPWGGAGDAAGKPWAFDAWRVSSIIAAGQVGRWLSGEAAIFRRGAKLFAGRA